MAVRARKVFLIILTLQIGILLAYYLIRRFTSYDISWHAIHALGLQTLTQDSNLFVQSVNISKSGTGVSSKGHVTYWPSRISSVKQTTAISSMRWGSGEARGSAQTVNGQTTLKGAEYNTTSSTPTEHTNTAGTFQPIDGKDAWVYSAYFDHVAAQQGLPMVRIIGAVHRDLLTTVYCNFSTSSGHLVQVGSVREFPDSHDVRFPPSYIECCLPANTRPTLVSVSFQPNRTSTNQLQITFPGTLSRNFTVCYSVLHSRFSSAAQLIQSIEMNRILGADHLMVYIYSVSPAVDQILQRYQQDGLVTVLPWPIPTKESWYYAQTSALNDCFYRNRNISRFVVVVDTDEFIIPKNHSNWMELIAAISPQEYDVSTFMNSTDPSQKAGVKTGCFIVSSCYFSTNSWTTLDRTPFPVSILRRGKE
ncbi:hypothetical protein BsWGS_22538 [Bradybaena similaris]